ncbi:MAG: sulfurtransferase [Alcanivoracaceae bacterium]|nr:sulfurtransferase [Alcanivoracaceae bacterium]
MGKPSTGVTTMKSLIQILVIACSLLASPLWAADSISISELKQAMQTGKTPIIIDVRDEDEYLAGHIPGAILVPAKNVEHHMDMLEKYKKEEIVLYCQSGRRASAAATTLENAGFKHVKLLEGDFPGWQASK